jgi:hypothetical protein
MGERLKRPSAKSEPPKRAPAQRRPRGNPNWVPGVSGNPSGKAALTEDDHRARYSARHYEPEAIRKLVALMRSSSSEAVQLGAARELLDRARGKPPVAILSANVDVEIDTEALQGADLEQLSDTFAAMIGVGNMPRVLDVTPSTSSNGMARRIEDTRRRLDALQAEAEEE